MTTLTLEGNIWTGIRGQSIPNGRVVIRKEKITALGPASDIPCEGQHIDYGDNWILPGLIDTHCHLIFGEAGRSYEEYIREDSDDIMLLRAARNARIHQSVGVTTLRDSGSRNNTVISLKNGLERNYLTGPRMLVSGRPVTVTGGHFWWCNEEADGVDEVRKAVRKLAKDGVDFIKIMASGGGSKGTDPTIPAFTLEEMCAIVGEAHQRRLKCSAHCEATAAVERAVKAGVDAIEHAGFQEPDGTRTYREDLVQMMVEKGLAYSPTIQTAYRGLVKFTEEGADSSQSRERVRAAHYKLSRKLENLGRMLDAGVNVIAGTDAISQFGDYVTGLELFVFAGMTPEEALLSATSIAAREIGVDSISGSLEVGKVADMLIVEGDPRESIANLRNVQDVFQGAKRVEVPSYIGDQLPDQSRPGFSSDIDAVMAEAEEAG